MLNRIRHRATMAALLALAMLSALVAGFAVPASANAGPLNCSLYGWVNPGGSHRVYSPLYYYTQVNGSYLHAGCAVIGVVTEPDGIHYRYAVRVQDLEETGYGVTNLTDNGRIIPSIRFGYQAASARWAMTYDQTVNTYFNEGTGYVTWYSPMYCSCGPEGHPENQEWFITLTTQYQTYGGSQLFTATPVERRVGPVYG